MQNVATMKIGTKTSLGGPSGPSFFIFHHIDFIQYSAIIELMIITISRYIWKGINMKQYDIIVVGTGGATIVADAAIKVGKKVAIIEKGKFGGTWVQF